MILAKPLTRKGLGQTPDSEPMPESAPYRNQIVTISNPKKNHFKTSRNTEKRELKPKDRKKIILFIIRDEPGISHAGICRIMRQFCSKQGYINNTTEYSYYLKLLIKEEKILRIRVADTWRYIPYVR